MRQSQDGTEQSRKDGQRYVVDVNPPWEDTPELRARLGDLLKLPPAKVDALLRRLPATVTKPIEEGTALTVARRFRHAGLDASIRRYQEQDSSGVAAAGPTRDAQLPRAAQEASVGPTASPSRSATGAERDIPPSAAEEDPADAQGVGRGHQGTLGRSGQRRDPPRHPSPSESIWKTGLGTDRPLELGSTDDDEMFPKSAFGQQRRRRRAPPPKPPSKPLLIALAIVVAVLATLWLFF